MSNFIQDTIQSETSLQNNGIEAALRMGNVAYVKTNPGPGEFSSVVSALASISTNAVSSPWLVMVGPGVYTEAAITMKSYVHVMGSGDEITRLIASSTTGTFITAADNSSISKCLISGATGSGGIGIQYSGTTGSDSTPFTVTSCRLGAHETIAKVSSSTAALQMTFMDCRIGGPYTFSNGFFATTSGAGTAKIQLMGCTTNGTNTNTINYIGYASGAGCEIIVNACQFRSTAVTTGAGFRCDTGGGLRMSSLNIRNFATGIDVPNTGAAPVLNCSAILIQNCTADINIAHTGCTGSFLGVSTSSKITNSAAGVQLFYQDPTYGAVCNGVTDITGFRTQKGTTTTSNSTLSLVASSAMCQEFTGSTSGQIVKLPDATTLQVGHRFEIWNSSSALITVNDNGSNNLSGQSANSKLTLVCKDGSTAAGIWLSEFDDLNSAFNLSTTASFIDDFIAGTSVGVSTLGSLRWAMFSTGTGAAITQPSNQIDNTHIGVGNLAVGAVSAISSLVLANIQIGGGQLIYETLVRVGALGTGTQNYVMQFGLVSGNEQSTSDATDGIIFEYSQAASTQWRCRTTAASTSTNTLSGVTVAANSWYKLKFIINPAASQVQFYISAAGGGNPTLVATTSTNIPATSTALEPIYKIRKTVGTTVVSYDVDYFQMQINLTNSR